MIAKLSGIIDSTSEDSLIIEVGGVGYHVFCSGRTLNAMAMTGGTVSLYIETHVREDHIHLFGFWFFSQHLTLPWVTPTQLAFPPSPSARTGL